jgi:dihydroflavonol-4-reductase
MNILVTGANGFIGSRICLHLKNLGHDLIGLVRKQSDLALIKDSGITLVYGDITDRKSLNGIFKDVDIVIHSAGAVTDWGPYEYFETCNVKGTQNIALEAAAAGVKRMVQISSVAIHGFGFKYANENQASPPNKVGYSESKRMAELWLKDFMHKTGMEISIIRPGNVFGPYDEKFIAPYLELIDKGQFVYINGGKALTCPTYIENLVHGVALCCVEPNAKGQEFIITDGLDISWKQFTDALFIQLDKIPVKRSVPYSFMYFISYLMEMVYTLFRIKKAPLLTRYRINNAGKDYHFSIDKAITLLGYKPVVDFHTSISRTVDWYLRTQQNKK